MRFFYENIQVKNKGSADCCCCSRWALRRKMWKKWRQRKQWKKVCLLMLLWGVVVVWCCLSLSEQSRLNKCCWAEGFAPCTLKVARSFLLKCFVFSFCSFCSPLDLSSYIFMFFSQPKKKSRKNSQQIHLHNFLFLNWKTEKRQKISAARQNLL